MQKTTKKRRIILASIITLLIAIGSAGVFVAGNDYRLQENAVLIPFDGGHLAGVLTMPPGGESAGLVVMVHGDAAVDATQGGLYYPWFEAAADAGWATLSWSKAGVQGSTGNWLTQTMDDRATEIGAAIDWAKGQSTVPTDHIVLWGASQAGWVLPKVVAARGDIDAVVAVSTAVNWIRQGRYNSSAELEHQRATAAEISAATTRSARIRALLHHGASYAEYLAATQEQTPMTHDRWEFVSLNFRSDATHDLQAAARRGIPWHLMEANYDRNVDIAETEQVYREILGESLSVTRFDAAHSMARPIMEDSPFIGFITATAWPRALFPENVLANYRAFLTGRTQ